ncbi:hypothetical protein HYW20_04635 [Candidatus Woesearchaeota archaeon]|nr:hypothetical protein [Candidatus Woesearchaeota archaeon]
MNGLERRIKKTGGGEPRKSTCKKTFSERISEGVDKLEYRLNPVLEEYAWRFKRGLDRVSEATAILAGSAFAIEKYTRGIFEAHDSGDRAAIAMTAGGVAALLVGAMGAWHKRQYIGEKISEWRRHSKKNKARHWTAFTGTTAILLGILARMEYPILYDRIINPPAVREVSYTSPEVPPSEYVEVKGIPRPLQAEIYWMTKSQWARNEMTKQIRKFDTEYKAFVEKYFNKYLAKDGRLSLEDVFGIMSTESKMDSTAISDWSAGGLMQEMPFVVEKRKDECGGGSLYITENVRKAKKTGDKKYYKPYANELKNLKAKHTKVELARRYAAFDPEKNICMGVRHLKFLMDRYPKDDKDSLLVKYNTNANWVEYAKAEMGTDKFAEYASFFRQKESRDYPYKVRAAAHIYKHTPQDKEVRNNNYYIKTPTVLQSLPTQKQNVLRR